MPQLLRIHRGPGHGGPLSGAEPIQHGLDLCGRLRGAVGTGDGSQLTAGRPREEQRHQAREEEGRRRNHQSPSRRNIAHSWISDTD